MVKERRARQRRTFTGKVKLFWMQEGIHRQVIGEILDISRQGLRCAVDQRLPAGTQLHLECKPEHLHGEAVVRHCANKGIRYIIGMEFRGTLCWKGDNDGPIPRSWD